MSMLFLACVIPSLVVSSLLLSPLAATARINGNPSTSAAAAFGHASKYLLTVENGQGLMHEQKGSFFNAFAHVCFSSFVSKVSMHMQGSTKVLPATGPFPDISFLVFPIVITMRLVNFASACLIS